MKKIKYCYHYKIQNIENKLRFKSLSKIEKRNRIINKLFTAFIIAVFFFWVVAFAFLASKNNIFISNKNLSITISVMCWILLFPGSIAITAAHLLLFKNIIPPVTQGKITSEMIIKITKPLRNYYEVPEKNYIVTKCYKSSNELLSDKDLLLFFVDGKLRITNNLYQSKKDLGCLEFSKEETSVKNIIDGKLVKTMIKCDGFYLELGYRARTYIYKYWEMK